MTEQLASREEILDGGNLAGRILTHSNDALLVFDPAADRILEANPKACRMLGYRREQLLETPISAVSPSEVPRLLALARSGLAEDGVIEDLVCLSSRGEVVRTEVSASTVDLGTGTAVIASMREATERKRTEEELHHWAFHDRLTGLPNRHLLMDRMTMALARTKRRPGQVAVLFFDLDRFKLVNDSYGHAAGDEVLVAVSQRMESVLRPCDTAARFGGDEFAILSEDIMSDAHAIAIAERLSETISEPFDMEGVQVVLSISVGVALSTVVDASPASLIRNADAAMYRAKKRGKGRYELFNTEMRSRARERLKGENDLRRALEQDELRLFYQPEIDLETGEVVALEALLRWDHPEHGLLLPADFLGLAEESHLIVPIGAWVLEQACLQAQRWRTLKHSDSPLTIAVNLAIRQLNESDLESMVDKVLSDTGTEPSSLCLEITENAVMEDFDASLKGLEALKDLGVSLAIDDLGTGYSALSLLKRLPVDTLKIDRSFVEGLGRDAADLAIVSAMVRMADGLDMIVVAEGVETAGQRDILTSLDCPLAQGFYFSPPRPPRDVSELLTEGALSLR
jgi:diguanylate cyclase (GGDEF)-like protein/PAS domain S-box-containing protein